MLTLSQDAHAGYSLYNRLSPLIHTMQKPPEPSCYTFDAIRGRLCEPSGMTWSPFNPDYDPGPPPPPRPVKAPPTDLLGSANVIALSSGSPSTARLKRPIVPNSGSSVRPSSTLTRNHDGDESAPTAKRKRYRTKPRKKT